MVLLWSGTRRPLHFRILILPKRPASVSQTRLVRAKSTKSKKSGKKKKFSYQTPVSPNKLPATKFPDHQKVNGQQRPVPDAIGDVFGAKANVSSRGFEPRSRRFWLWSFTAGLGIYCGFWLYFQELVPISGRKRFRWVPDWYVERRARRKTRENKAEVAQFVVPTPPLLEQYFDEMVDIIGLRHLNCELQIVASKIPNASSSADGQIFVTTQLVEIMSNGFELLSILAHELAHIKAKHAAELHSESKFFALPLLSLWLLSFIPIIGLIPEIILFKHKLSVLRASREREIEADYIGMKLAAAWGIPPHFAIRGMQKSSEWENLEMAKIKAMVGWRFKPGELESIVRKLKSLSTHPETEDRVKQMKAWAPEMLKIQRKAWANEIAKVKERKRRWASYRNFIRSPHNYLYRFKIRTAPWLSMDDMTAAKELWWRKACATFKANQQHCIDSNRKIIIQMAKMKRVIMKREEIRRRKRRKDVAAGRVEMRRAVPQIWTPTWQDTVKGLKAVDGLVSED